MMSMFSFLKVNTDFFLLEFVNGAAAWAAEHDEVGTLFLDADMSWEDTRKDDERATTNKAKGIQKIKIVYFLDQ